MTQIITVNDERAANGLEPLERDEFGNDRGAYVYRFGTLCAEGAFGDYHDWYRWSQNILEGNGHNLCEHCQGCGNELFSMYRKCPECGGTGVVE